MTNNDVLRSVRYMLNLNDTQMVAIVAQTESEVSEAEMQSFLKKRKNPDFAPART